MQRIKTPMLFMWVNDRELSDDSVRRITNLSVTYREKKATDGTFTVSDPDFLFTDNKIFKQGQRVSFLLGWNDEAIPCGPFVVKSYDISATGEGNPVLNVSFQDLSHKMNKKTKKKKHTGKPVDIIKSIAEYHNLGYDIESIRDLEFSDDYPLIQSNVSDAKLLQILATRYGYVWGLEGTTLYFRLPQNSDEVGRQDDIPVLSYRINGATLMSFTASAKFIRKGKKKGSAEEKDTVDVIGDTVAELAESVIGEENTKMLRENMSDGLSKAKELVGVEDPDQELSDEEEKEKNKEQQSASSKFRKDFEEFKGIFKTVEEKLTDGGKDDENSSDSNVDGTTDPADEAKRKMAGRMAGRTEIIEATIVPRLASMLYRPSDSLIIAGLGERFSGKYRISSVTHTYGGSPPFRTSITAKKRNFGASAKSKAAIANKQDSDEADKVPGNKNSADGQPQKGVQTYQAVDFDELPGNHKVVTRRVDGNDV